MNNASTIEQLTLKMNLLEQRLNRLVPGAPNQKCFTVEDVAKMRGCTAKTIRKDEKAGILIARYPTAKKRYHIDDLEWYLRGRMPRS